MLRRLCIYSVTLATFALMLYPLRWKRHEDNFPMSNYPMFAKAKSKPVLGVNYAIGIDREGERHFFSPAYVGNQEVLQARAIFDRKFGQGATGHEELCGMIISKLLELDEPRLRGVVEVRLLRGNYDAVEYLTGKTTTGREKVYKSCLVAERQ